jgi:urea transporter
VFVLGLFVHSKNAATWAMIGSGVGLLIGRSFGFPDDLVFLGSYGFNGSLVGIALSSRFGKEVFPILLGILLSVLLARTFELTTLPALTAPFVIATWAVSWLIPIDTKVGEGSPM